MSWQGSWPLIAMARIFTPYTLSLYNELNSCIFLISPFIWQFFTCQAMMRSAAGSIQNEIVVRHSSGTFPSLKIVVFLGNLRILDLFSPIGWTSYMKNNLADLEIQHCDIWFFSVCFVIYDSNSGSRSIAHPLICYCRIIIPLVVQ